MIVFHVQSIREKPFPDEERVKGNAALDLATIHHICEANLKELQNMAKTKVRRRQIVPVLSLAGSFMCAFSSSRALLKLW